MKKLCVLIGSACVAFAAFAGTGVTERELGEAISNVVTYVDEAIKEVDMTGVSNIVQRSASSVVETLLPELETWEVTTNNIFVYHKVYVTNTIAYREDIRFHKQIVPHSIDQLGAKVVQSTIENLPVGTLYACADNGTNLVSAASSVPVLNYSSEYKTGASGLYKCYSLRAEVGSNVYETDNDGDTTLRLFKMGGAETNIVEGIALIKPCRLTVEQRNACLGPAHTYGAHNEWAETEHEVITDFDVIFTQILDGQVKVPRRRLSFLDLFVGTSFGASMPPPNVPISSEPKVGQVPTDSFMERPKNEDGTDKDGHWDKDPWWTPQAWNTTEAWITFPVQMTTYYLGRDGEYYPISVKCSNINQLNQILRGDFGAPSISIPPYPYVYPKFIEKQKCGAGRHVWKKCICLNCGAEREHKFLPASGGYCSTCENKDSNYTVDWGFYVYKGESDTKCGRPCTRSDMMYHTGWHDIDSDDEYYYCCCQCGYYTTHGGKDHLILSHNFPTEAEGGATWTYFDSNQHRTQVQCRRCTAKKWIYEQHDIERDEDPTYEMIDETYHYASGWCEKCNHSGEVIEFHFPDPNNTANCVCPCGAECHDEIPNGCFAFCVRCGRGYGRATPNSAPAWIAAGSICPEDHKETLGSLLQCEEGDEHRDDFHFCNCAVSGITTGLGFYFPHVYQGDGTICLICRYDSSDDGDGEKGPRQEKCPFIYNSKGTLSRASDHSDDYKFYQNSGGRSWCSNSGGGLGFGCGGDFSNDAIRRGRPYNSNYPVRLFSKNYTTFLSGGGVSANFDSGVHWINPASLPVPFNWISVSPMDRCQSYTESIEYNIKDSSQPQYDPVLDEYTDNWQDYDVIIYSGTHFFDR